MLDPLDFLVAGPSVLFLIIDIFLYWFIIYTFERGVWKKLRARLFRGRDELGPRNKDMNSIVEDEDIVEEEQRVANSDP